MYHNLLMVIYYRWGPIFLSTLMWISGCQQADITTYYHGRNKQEGIAYAKLPHSPVFPCILIHIYYMGWAWGGLLHPIVISTLIIYTVLQGYILPSLFKIFNKLLYPASPIHHATVHPHFYRPCATRLQHANKARASPLRDLCPTCGVRRYGILGFRHAWKAWRAVCERRLHFLVHDGILSWCGKN